MKGSYFEVTKSLCEMNLDLEQFRQGASILAAAKFAPKVQGSIVYLHAS